MAEALKTITAPIRHSASVTPKSLPVGLQATRHRYPLWAGSSARPIAFPSLRDQLLEHAAAMLVIFELIEARTRRREQHDVARPRALRRQLDGAVERAGVHARDGVAQIRGDLFRGRADQQSRAVPRAEAARAAACTGCLCPCRPE